MDHITVSSSTKDYLISVVIPAYNAELTLPETLRSVRSQTHQSLEIIIVDDGSTDQTVAVARAHAEADSRIKVLSQMNAGVAAARNAGWQTASSDLIAFVDADDLWQSTKIEKQLAVMLEGGYQVGLVYTWFMVVDEWNQIRFRARSRHISGDVLDRILEGNFVGNGSSPLIRREALIAARGYDSGLHRARVHGCEDMLLYYRIARQFHFGLVPEHLTGYRVVSGRMSSDRLRMFRSFKMVTDEMKKDYPERHRSVDLGIGLYLQFLIGEAAAYGDFHQVLPLARNWFPAHPIDGATILIAVVCRKAIIFAVRLPELLSRLLGATKRPMFPSGDH